MNKGPGSYRDTIEQITGYWHDGTPVAHLIEIVTEGSDYLLDRTWDAMTPAERAEHDEWVEDLHNAQVHLAQQEPDVRERTEAIIAKGQANSEDYDAGAIESAIEHAIEEVT